MRSHIHISTGTLIYTNQETCLSSCLCYMLPVGELVPVGPTWLVQAIPTRGLWGADREDSSGATPTHPPCGVVTYPVTSTCEVGQETN